MASAPDAHLRRYLLDGERVVVAVRRHWVQILEPTLTTAAGLALTLWIDATLQPGAVVLARLAWWGWFLLVARLIWCVVQWRVDWFVATDKRLVLTQGLLTRKVAMMPLAKVTDMSFVQSTPGRLLGYGQFVMESAGQEQSLREVDWIPHATYTYRVICAEIFGVDDHARVLPRPEAGTGDGGDDWDGGSAEPGALGEPDPSRRESGARPVHRPASEPGHRPAASEPAYRPAASEAETERARDTGPVLNYPSD